MNRLAKKTSKAVLAHGSPFFSNISIFLGPIRWVPPTGNKTSENGNIKSKLSKKTTINVSKSRLPSVTVNGLGGEKKTTEFLVINF